MHNYNFFDYNREEEEKDGEYWQFLDTSLQDLNDAGIYIKDVVAILDDIKDADLRIKMRKKIYDIIYENGVYTVGSFVLKIFDDIEVKKLLEHELDVKIENCKDDPNIFRSNFSDFKWSIYLFKEVDDINWRNNMIIRIIELFKDNKDKSLLINLIEYNSDNKKFYKELLDKYFNLLPNEYKKYLEMIDDPNYIHDKALKFNKEDLDIGIDPKISIGPEIEANNDFGIHINLESQNCHNLFDRTIDATVPNGDEVYAKKPFHNIKDEVAIFCGLCEAMKDIGYYYDEHSSNASGQINLGLDYLDSKEAILNFYEIYGNCEELLYYISSEEGQLFRQDVYSSSRIKPISEIIGKRNLDEEFTREDVIKLFNNGYGSDPNVIKGLEYKKNSVCLRGTNNRDYRFEFRIPNGGCNYRTWIDNIRLYGKMMEVSKKLADLMKKDYLTTEEENLLKHKIDLQDKKLSLEEKLVKLMNLLFDDDKIREIYYNRFITTNKLIKETNSKKYMNHYISDQPSFDEVEFVDNYKSRLDVDYDDKYNPYDKIKH